MTKIFGYDWEDIQRAQQGGRLSRPVYAMPSDLTADRKEEDMALLKKHGLDGLKAMGYHGVIDRLNRYC